MNPDTDPTPTKDRTGIALVLVLALSFGVFAPTLNNGFTFDDSHYARAQTPTEDRNPMVAELQPFSEYWQKPMNWGLPTRGRGYRPVTVYSYAVVNQILWNPNGETPAARQGEDTAWAHHLLNLLLHVLGTGLVFLATRSLTQVGTTSPTTVGPALIAALVFGVHALHSGPVASIVGRAELLAFTFGATAMLTYHAALMNRGMARNWRLLVAMATTFLALGAKESAMAWAVFIPLFALAHRVPLKRQIVPWLVAIAGPLLVFLVLRGDALAPGGATPASFWVEHDANPLYYRSTVERVINATPILAYAMGKVLWPCNLSSNYGDGPFTLFESVLHWRFLLSLVGLLAVLVAGVRARTRHPMLFLATAAFFGFSFITSNIPFPIETIFGDRLLYTPVLGAALLAAWLARHVPSRFRLAAAGALLVFVAHNVWLSIERSIAWHDNRSLFTLDLQSQPDSIGLHIDMGNLHLENFDPAAARGEFATATQIRPDSPRALRMLAEHSDPAQARDLLGRALRSRHMIPATEGRRIHWALARLHETANRPEQAWREYQTALACNPRVADIRLHLLRETAMRGDWKEFEQLLRAGLALDPDNAYFKMNRGVWLHHQGKFAQATAELQRVLPGLPDQAQVVEAWMRLADCHLRTRHPAKARAIALHFRWAAQQLPAVRRERERILAATRSVAGPGR